MQIQEDEYVRIIDYFNQMRGEIKWTSKKEISFGR